MAARDAPSQSDDIKDPVGSGGCFFAAEPTFAFEDQLDTSSSFLIDDALAEILRSSHCPTPNHSTISQQTIESQSSLCVGSRISADKPECEYYHVRGATSDYSSHELLSDDEDAETETGLCGESEDPSVLKRLKRIASNRESAKRSRMKKQVHQQKLELQVKQLGRENATLLMQLENASLQFRDSVTTYRVLRSYGDAIRAEVKLLEERVAGSSLTSGLDQLLQSHLSSPQLLNPLSTCRLTNVSPIVAAHGDDASFGMPVVSGQTVALGNQNADTNNVSVFRNGIIREDGITCATPVWPPDYGSLSK